MIDWCMVCNNLRARYKSLSSVAKEVGSDWQHLNRLARREVQEPKFTVGVKLLDLHHDHCPDKHSEVLR